MRGVDMYTELYGAAKELSAKFSSRGAKLLSKPRQRQIESV